MMTCVNTPDIMPDNRSKGQIQVIFGPMFSGKTTELIRRMKRFALANYDCLTVKYSNDDRYNKENISTHDSQVLEATVSTMELMPTFQEAKQYDVVGVDEGQFFPDVVCFCEALAELGKVVIVAALDGTYQRQGFGDILQLVPLAENVMKLTAVCMMCFGEASFTKRKGHETQVEVIGGAEKYLAVCRACYKQSPLKRSPHPKNPRKEGHLNYDSAEKLSAGRRLFQTPPTLTVTAPPNLQ